MTISQIKPITFGQTQSHHPEYAKVMISNLTAQILFTASSSLLLILPQVLLERGITVGWHGWIMASYSLFYAIGLFNGKSVITRLGNRWTIVMGCILAATGCFFLLTGHQLLVLYFAGRALHGIGCAWIFLPLQGQVMRLSANHLRGQTIGLVNLPGFITLAISPFIAELLSNTGKPDGIFLIAGIVCLLLLPLAKSVPVNAESSVNPTVIQGYRERITTLEWLAIIFSFVQGISLELPKILLPLITLTANSWCFASFFFFYGTSAFIFRIFLESRLRMQIPLWAMVATGCLVPIGIPCFTMASSITEFGAIGFIFGLGHGLFYPSLVQLFTRHAETNSLVWRLSNLTAAMTFGLILGQVSASVGAKFLGINSTLWWSGLLLLAIQVAILIAMWYHDKSSIDHSFNKDVNNKYSYCGVIK